MLHCSRVSLALGLLSLALALLLALESRPMAQRIQGRVMSRIREQVVWQPDSPKAVAERFQGDDRPDAPPVYVRFRFFNITNLQAVRTGARPVLQEVGPYTFRKHRVKRGVRFVDGTAAVRFHEYHYHLFAPELSHGSQDDPITTLNIPLIGALAHIEALGAWKARPLLELLASLVERWGDSAVRGLFTTRPVRDLLWGYRDTLLSRLSLLVPSIDPTFRLVGNMSSPEEADAVPATQANTGVDDLSQVWQYQEWEGVSQVTSWNPPHLETVRGTDAFVFRPGLALGDSVDVWVGELYRAARLIAKEKASLGGVPLLRLLGDPAEGDPDPRYFQTIRGLMNITSPTAGGPAGKPGQPGPPIFLSYPHFCDADPQLAAGVEGLACNPEQHNTFLDVEPSTGITLRAAKRLMMSSWFGGKYSLIDPAARDTYLPIFWAEESSQASQQQLRQFRPLLWARAAVAGLLQYGQPAAFGLALLAVGWLCVAAVLWQDGSSGGGGADDTGSSRAAQAGYNDLSGEVEAGLQLDQASDATQVVLTSAGSSGSSGQAAAVAAAGQASEKQPLLQPPQQQQGGQEPAGPDELEAGNGNSEDSTSGSNPAHRRKFFFL